MVVKKKDNIVARSVHGTSFLIDISDKYSGDKCAIYEINKTGMFLWNHIDGIRSVEALSLLLQAAIVDDVDYEIIYNDVMAFINFIILENFVEVI